MISPNLDINLIDEEEFDELFSLFSEEERKKIKQIVKEPKKKDWSCEFWNVVHTSKNPKIKTWYEKRLNRIVKEHYKKLQEEEKHAQNNQ